MADTIRLAIELQDGAIVLQQLNQIDKVAQGLDKEKVKIDVDTGDLSKLVSGLKAVEASNKSVNGKLASETIKASAATGELIKQTTNYGKESTTVTTTVTKNFQKQEQAAAKAAQQLQKYKESQNSKTGTWIDAQIKQRETESKSFSAQLKAQMEAEVKAEEEAAKAAQSTEELANKNNLLGASLETLAARFSVYTIANAAVNALVSSFKQALSTMKEVDTELTSIQKVTNISSSAAAALGDRAYAKASEYGVNVTDYLESVSTFAKAGYGDLAEDLAELATKTQLVGDTSADVASQFLLSADAAWDYSGSVEDLTEILDAANAVENNYATSIEKISEGFPIVANVASMVGMSADETIAALGTITATTQQSGESAARALRALILNIMGDTTTEIEDGVTATTESIESVNDVLWKYSASVMEAAQASGEIVNPLEAIAGLSQAAKDGLMTEADLADLASSLGGKLRTNELLALIENWDTTFAGMMDTISTSAGSADTEVGTMLTSWESKTNQLSNQWTEFVSNLVDTSAIKGGLDVAINFLDMLNSFADIGPTNFSEQQQIVSDINSELSSQQSEYDALIAKGGSLNELEKERLGLLEAQIVATQKELDEANRSALEKWQMETGTAGVSDASSYSWIDWAAAGVTGSLPENITKDVQVLNDMSAAVADLNAQFSETADIDSYKEGLSNLISENSAYFDQLQEFVDEGLGNELTDSQREGLEVYAALGNMLSNLRGISNGAAEGTYVLSDSVNQTSDDVTTLTDNLTEATAALEAFKNATSSEKGDTAGEYSSAYSSALEAANNGYYGSNTLQAGADLLFSDDFKAKLDYNTQAYAEALTNVDGIFNKVFNEGAGNEGAAFINFMHDAATAAGDASTLFSEAGEEIMTFQENADGSLSFDYSSLEDLSEATGLSVEAISSILEQTELYSQVAHMSAEDVSGLTRQLESLNHGAVSGSEGLEAVVSDIIALPEYADASAQEVANLVYALEEAGYIDLSGLDGNIGAIIADLMGAEQQANATGAALDGVSNASPEVDATVTGQEEVDNLASSIDSVEDKDTTLTGKTVGETAIQSLKNLWDSIQSKTVTLRTVTSSSGGISGRAIGDSNYKGGPALVNEVGPEIISANGKAWIAGGGAPTITDVPKGAIILTAKQTKEALHGGSMGGVVASHAEGIPSFWAGKVPTSSSVKSSGGSSGGGGTVAVAAATSSNALSEDELEELETELNDALKVLDLQAELAERQGDAEAVLGYYAQAEEKINELIEKYRASGYADDSKEILELINKGYDYADDRVDVGDDLWDELIDSIKAAKDSIDDANDLADEQNKIAEREQDILEAQEKVDKAQKALTTAQTQRTVRVYNKETKQWEWIADAQEVADAQEDLEDAKDNLADAKEDLEDAKQDYQDALLDAALEKLEASAGMDLNDVVIGDAIYAMLNDATEETQQAFLNALGALYGVSDYTTGDKAESLFTSGDSHDTNYYFPGGITLTEGQAEKTTLADIAKQLRVLGVT